ncbi:MAG: alpha/beta fold hydrolase [Chloroflexota bacterium]
MRTDDTGRRLAVYPAGHGAVPVLLEAGLTDPADIWKDVQHGVATFTRVCSYDRPGRGQSDPAPTPRTCEDLVVDLECVLSACGGGGPFVLVGHSFGGLVTLRFAQRHPDAVAGLVFVDSSHPRQMESILKTISRQPSAENHSLGRYRDRLVAMFRDPTLNWEGIDIGASMREVKPPAPLGDFPVAVLTADSVFHDLEIDPQSVGGLTGTWRCLQAEFTTLSPRVLARVVPGSTHYVFRSHAQDVVEAIRWVVRESSAGH